MSIMAKTRSTRGEVAARGQELYERAIRAQVEPAHDGEFLALDIETGDYEIDASELAAVRRARAKRPDARLYLVRVGERAAYRLGRAHPHSLP
jgi:hypothetical protein